MKRYLVIFAEMVMRFLFAMPRFSLCNAVKAFYLRLCGARVGKRCVFYPGVWIMTGRRLRLGDDVDLALEVLITTDGGVEIGDRSMIGYRTQILSANHVVPPVNERIFGAGHVYRKVVIENDVWVGGNCMILPGVTIGQGAVVGGGSVVVRSIPPFAVAVGNPAKVVRMRDRKDQSD